MKQTARFPQNSDMSWSNWDIEETGTNNQVSKGDQSDQDTNDTEAIDDEKKSHERHQDELWGHRVRCQDCYRKWITTNVGPESAFHWQRRQPGIWTKTSGLWWMRRTDIRIPLKSYIIQEYSRGSKGWPEGLKWGHTCIQPHEYKVDGKPFHPDYWRYWRLHWGKWQDWQIHQEIYRGHGRCHTHENGGPEQLSDRPGRPGNPPRIILAPTPRNRIFSKIGFRGHTLWYLANTVQESTPSSKG